MSLHYVIDGYNVIKQTPSWKDKKLQDSRNLLVRFIQSNNIIGSPRNKITIVFDAQGNDASFLQDSQSTQIGQSSSIVNIVFARRQTADEEIVDICKKHPNPKILVLISDDRQLRFNARSFGAQLMSVRDFLNKANKSDKLKGARNDVHRLSAAQEREINEELGKIWLKEK